jgi:hypothetical protein
MTWGYAKVLTLLFVLGSVGVVVGLVARGCAG